MKKYLLLLFIASLFLACDFDSDIDNGNVTVFNNTTLPIRVYYVYEEESDSSSFSSENDDNVNVVSDSVTIGAGESKYLTIQSSIIYKGKLDIVYGGILKNYVVDFNIFDNADKTIIESHFHDLVE